MAPNQHKKPCGECIFRRDSVPGETGGSPVQTYVGQIRGPFWIPCHCSRGYRGKESRFGEESECAGAATFRANLGLTSIMPSPLLRVEPDHENVFSTFAEFVAHHEGVSLERATAMLKHMPPEALCLKEYMKEGVRHNIAATDTDPTKSIRSLPEKLHARSCKN